MGHYRELLAWQKSMELVHAVYIATRQFPQHELYGLVSQIRRAAVSVPSNIAEGQAHHASRDFVRFLRLCRGSLAELETQLIISCQLSYLDSSDRDALLKRSDEINRMLAGLIASLERRESQGTG